MQGILTLEGELALTNSEISENEVGECESGAKKVLKKLTFFEGGGIMILILFFYSKSYGKHTTN